MAEDWTFSKLRQVIGSTPPTPQGSPVVVTREVFSDKFLICRYPTAQNRDDLIQAITDGIGSPLEKYLTVRYELVSHLGVHREKYENVFKEAAEDGENYNTSVVGPQVPAVLLVAAAATVYRIQIDIRSEASGEVLRSFGGRNKRSSSIHDASASVSLAFHEYKGTWSLLKPREAVTGVPSLPLAAAESSDILVDTSHLSSMEAITQPMQPLESLPPQILPFPFGNVQDFIQNVEADLARTSHGKIWLEKLRTTEIPKKHGKKPRYDRNLTFIFGRRYLHIIFDFYHQYRCAGCSENFLPTDIPFLQLSPLTEDNCAMFDGLCYCHTCYPQSSSLSDRPPCNCQSSNPAVDPGNCKFCVRARKCACTEFMHNCKGIEMGDIGSSNPLHLAFLEIFLHNWPRPADYYAWTQDRQAKWLLTNGLFRRLSGEAGAKAEYYAGPRQKKAIEAATATQVKEWQEHQREKFSVHTLRPADLITVNTITLSGACAATIAIDAGGDLRAAEILHHEDVSIPPGWTPPPTFRLDGKADYVNHTAESYRVAMKWVEQVVSEKVTNVAPQYMHDDLNALDQSFWHRIEADHRADSPQSRNGLKLKSFGKVVGSRPINPTYAYTIHQNMIDRFKVWKKLNKNATSFERIRAAIFIIQSVCIRRNIVYAYHYTRWTDLTGKIYAPNSGITTKTPKVTGVSVAGFQGRHRSKVGPVNEDEGDIESDEDVEDGCFGIDDNEAVSLREESDSSSDELARVSAPHPKRSRNQ